MRGGVPEMLRKVSCFTRVVSAGLLLLVFPVLRSVCSGLPWFEGAGRDKMQRRGTALNPLRWRQCVCVHVCLQSAAATTTSSTPIPFCDGISSLLPSPTPRKDKMEVVSSQRVLESVCSGTDICVSLWQRQAESFLRTQMEERKQSWHVFISSLFSRSYFLCVVWDVHKHRCVIYYIYIYKCACFIHVLFFFVWRKKRITLSFPSVGIKLVL